MPRSEKLLHMLVDREAGNALDEAAFEKQVEQDLNYILQKQSEVGVDIVGDGELPRLGFSFYVKDRMSGFGGHSPRGTVTDFAKFPGYAKLKQQQAAKGDWISKSATLYAMPACQCAVQYDRDKRAAHQELRLFKSVPGTNRGRARGNRDFCDRGPLRALSLPLCCAIRLIPTTPLTETM